MLALDVSASHPGKPRGRRWLFKKPCEGWEVSRRQVRIYGTARTRVSKRRAMTVVTLPGAEILPAANAGVIDGAEWVGHGDPTLLYKLMEVPLHPGQHEPTTCG